MGLLDDAIREHLELKRRRGADAGDISREESEALGPVRRGPDGAPDLSDMVVPGPGGDAPPAGPSWDSDETSVLGTTPAAHEPPPAAAHQPASAPGYEPPPAPAYEPPSTAYEPPARSYEPPTTGYEPPPPPAAPPASERPWSDPDHSAYAPEPDPFADVLEPEPRPDVEPAEHHSLLSRFRGGRKSRQGPQPPPSDESLSGFEPPPLPSSYEPASPYEPPPATPPPPSYGYQAPLVQHEPDIVPADDEPDVEDVLEETPDFLEETPEHDRLWFEQRPPRDFDFDDK
jgi:hypothetical protein